VVERLSHHLLPRTFSEPLVARHVLTIVVWWLLGRLAPAGAARLRVDRFTLAAIAISAGGWAIALLEPVARAVQSFDQLELLRPVRFAEDKSWQWGPVVYTYTVDPPSMRAATRCVADLLQAIRPLVDAHVPGAAALLRAPAPLQG